MKTIILRTDKNSHRWPDKDASNDAETSIPENGAEVFIWHLGCGAGYFINGEFVFSTITQGIKKVRNPITAWQYCIPCRTIEEDQDNAREMRNLAAYHDNVRSYSYPESEA